MYGVHLSDMQRHTTKEHRREEYDRVHVYVFLTLHPHVCSYTGTSGSLLCRPQQLHYLRT